MSWAYETKTPNPVVVGALGDLELQKGNCAKVLKLADELEEKSGNHLSHENIQANHLKSFYLRGAVFHKLNQNLFALQNFGKIIPLLNANPLNHLFDPNFVYSMAGACYSSIGKLNNAITCYNEIIKTDPQNFGALVNRGTNYYKISKYIQAENDFGVALALHPKDKVAAHNLEQTLSKIRESNQKTIYTYRLTVFPP